MGWPGFIAVNRVAGRATVLVKRCAFLYIACWRRDPLTRRLGGLRGQRGTTCRIAWLRVDPYRRASEKKRKRYSFDNSRAPVSLRHIGIGLHTPNIEPSDIASIGIFFSIHKTYFPGDVDPDRTAARPLRKLSQGPQPVGITQKKPALDSPCMKYFTLDGASSGLLDKFLNPVGKNPRIPIRIHSFTFF